MTFEEVELWEIVLPSRTDYSKWYEYMRPHMIDGSYMLYDDGLKGYWVSLTEHSRVFRFAADLKSIKTICELTAELFEEKSVMVYRVSNKCLIGHK